MESSGGRGRRWKGLDADERQAGRRERLTDAAMTLLAEGGPSAVTMRGVSRAAGLTERYFYESFASREVLLVDLLTATVDEAERVLRHAVASAGPDPERVICRAVTEFTEFIAEDERRGRIMFVHSLSPELYPAARTYVGRITAVLAEAQELLLAAERGADGTASAAGAEAPAQAIGSADAGDSGPSGLPRRWDPLALFGAAAFVYQDWLGSQPRAESTEVSGYVSALVRRFLLSPR